MAALGIVATSAADLRRHPRHDAELRNQLLLGEALRIVGSRAGGQWLRVEALEDGYSGWLRAWALVPVGEAALRRWRLRARHRLAARFATLVSVDLPRRTLMPLFLGSRLERVRAAGGRAVVRLPDGRLGSLPASALQPAGRPAISLRRRVESLVGVPYLWGGRTPAGFDCSGFTQVVLAEQGIEVPRDAREQARETRPLKSSETPRSGDLVFFGRPREPVSHVGIMLDQCTFVHCRGTVHAASLSPDNALCEKDLLAQLRGFSRPGSRPPTARISARRRAKSA